jgi:hypothetical protein
MGERWWSIHEDEIRHMLQRVADGDSPDIVLLEFTANSVIEHVEGSGDG